MINGNFVTVKFMVIQNYNKISLVDLLDNLVHEFNHAINSITNEITWNSEEVSLRTGLSYINFYKE